jgi:hypothetical protein
MGAKIPLRLGHPLICIMRNPRLPQNVDLGPVIPPGVVGPEALLNSVLEKVDYLLRCKIPVGDPHQRHEELVAAVPKNDESKRLVLQSLFDDYKRRLDTQIYSFIQEWNPSNVLRDHIDDHIVLEKNLEMKMDELPEIFVSCNKTAFAQFPLLAVRVLEWTNPIMKSGLQGCRLEILECVSTEMSKLYNLQSTLDHETECEDGQSSCPHEALREAFMRRLSEKIPVMIKTAIERIESTVDVEIKSRAADLDEFFELLVEDPALTAERNDLMKEIKVLRRARNLLA